MLAAGWQKLYPQFFQSCFGTKQQIDTRKNKEKHAFLICSDRVPQWIESHRVAFRYLIPLQQLKILYTYPRVPQSNSHIHLEDVEKVLDLTLWLGFLQFKFGAMHRGLPLTVLHRNHSVQTCHCLQGICMPKSLTAHPYGVSTLFWTTMVLRLTESYGQSPQSVENVLQNYETPGETSNMTASENLGKNTSLLVTVKQTVYKNTNQNCCLHV